MENDKIVVLKQYDSLIEANLAKTKLDAYGVPCFLTDENFIGIYPIHNNVFPGVRLHIFEKDTTSANDILREQIEVVHEESENLCPKCQSNRIIYNETKKGFLNRLFLNVFIAPFFLPIKVFQCQTCGHEWDYKSSIE